jgi:hypothetical protein
MADSPCLPFNGHHAILSITNILTRYCAILSITNILTRYCAMLNTTNILTPVQHADSSIKVRRPISDNLSWKADVQECEPKKNSSESKEAILKVADFCRLLLLVLKLL